MIPGLGFARSFYRWLHMRRIDQWQRALGKLERELTRSATRPEFVKYQTQIAEIESAVRLLKVARHSKPIYTVSGSICTWFKKTFVEWGW